MEKHTFGNLTSDLFDNMHHIINLWCDFPEHRQDEGYPQTWTTKQRQDFLDRVLDKSRKKFEDFGYYLHEGKLNWSPRPKKYTK